MTKTRTPPGGDRAAESLGHEQSFSSSATSPNRQAIQPDSGQVREFVETYVAQARAATKGLDRPGLLQMILIHPAASEGKDEVVPYRYSLDDPDLAELMTRDAISASKNGHNVYVEGRTVRLGLTGKKRGSVEDSIAVFALVIDSDADKGLAWRPTVPVSLAVETSPGNAHFWLFFETAVDHATDITLGERLRAATGADHDTGNIVQPYRVAGTVNYPNRQKLARGRTIVQTRVLGFDPKNLWTVERFNDEFPPKPNGNGTHHGEQHAGRKICEEGVPADTMRAIREGVAEPHRSGVFWNVVIVLLDAGWTIDGIVALLERYPAGIAAKYHGRLQHEVRRISNKVRPQGQLEPNAQQRDEDEGERAESENGGSPRRVLPPPQFPMQVARLFALECCTFDGCSSGEFTLRHWRGGWWKWKSSHWVEVEERAVRALLYRFTEHAFFPHMKVLLPWAPTRKKIGDLLEALSAICILRSDVDQPSWLDGRSSGMIVAVANGLLDVQARSLLPHTPQFFNTTSVPFNYDHQAPQPKRWCSFLNMVWPTDPAAIDILAEWFGYVLSGKTDLHKIFLMVGPTRAGKGVVARLLTALIGRANVAGPTLHSLGGEFGLAPLLGKSLAVISDARFVGKNSNIVVERLLSISGEDMLTVNRKYRDQWTGKLPSRLHVISNELPALGDASQAIVGRIVLLPLSVSWLGKEDYNLEFELHGELPGILNWALDGLQRLAENKNRFTRLSAAEEAINLMRDLASPVAAFVRQRCETGPDKEIAVDKLYAAYRVWAEEHGHPKTSNANFGRDLRAAVSSVKRTRPRDGEARTYAYSGIDLVRSL
jgi:putative DNA primase/helicase